MSSVELTNEIWLRVFKSLTYNALKTCERVSKSFKALVQHSALDKTLFRSQAVIQRDDPITLSHVKIHPAFDLVQYGCSEDIEDAFFFNNSNDYHDTTPFEDTCAAKEHATHPPVGYLRIRVQDWKPMEVRNKNGITVVQVMKALCRLFAQTDREGNTLRDYMGDHTGWNGWDSKTLDRRGRLLLRADWFDS